VVGVGIGIIRNLKINKKNVGEMVKWEMDVRGIVDEDWNIKESRRCGIEGIKV
jgi:hypothetical protein